MKRIPASSLRRSPRPLRGAATFLLLLLGLSGCNLDLLFSGGSDRNGGGGAPAEAVDLVIVSGAGQSGTVGAPLANALVVCVTDSNDAPVVGARVTWTVVSGGGSLSEGSSLTGTDGRASTSLTLGTAPGTQAARAAVGELPPVDFTATAQSGGATSLVFTAQPTDADVGEAITPAVEVTARDRYGNRATAFDGAISLALSGGSGAATLTGIKTRAASAGVATFSGISVSAAGTSYRLGAAANGVSGATSDAFVVTQPTGGGGTPTALTVTSGNGQQGTVGEALPAQLVVRVTDVNGAPIPGVAVSWSVASGGGAVSPVTSTTNGDGRASATFTLGTGTGAHSVTATVTGLGPVTFTATARAGEPASLEFSTQPSDAGIGQVLTPPVRVTVRDQFGNTVTQFSGTITVSIVPQSGTPGASLAGTKSRAAVNGVATFDDLSILLPGVLYRLRATGAGTSVDSDTFTILL